MPLQNEKLLVFLPIPPPAGWLDKARERFPGVDIRWEVVQLNMAGKAGMSTVADLPEETREGVTLMCTFLPEAREVMKDVKFVQLASAGSDLWAKHPVFLDPGVQFCTGSGVHAPQIAEWVFGAWISHVHSFRKYDRDMQSETWDPRRDMKTLGSDSVGRRMGILGYGSIGRNCARFAKAMGMEVYVYTRTPRPTPESRVDTTTYCIPGTGDPEGVVPAAWFSGDLDEFLAQDLDILVVSAGLTEQTRSMIGKRQLEVLGGDGVAGRKKGFLCNIARGPIVDTDALTDALEKGTIAGAALDVTDPEPLPKGHPLWKAPNLFITPHVSWQSLNVMPRVADLLQKNLERLDKGEPLLNLIKK